MDELLAITVYGTAETAGSKRHVGRGKIIEDNPRAAGWKQEIANVAAAEWNGRPLLVDALELTVIFYRPRPQAHYGTGKNAGRLRPSAPRHPAKRPDLLKLARAVEDALTGVVWIDDALVVSEALLKRWADIGPERTRILIRTAPAS